MNRNSTWKWCLCVLVVLLACASSAPGRDTDTRTSFLSAYRKAYDKLVQNYTNIECSYLREYPMGKLVQLSSSEGKYKLYHFIIKYEERHVKKGTRETARKFPPIIEGANTKYGFQLVKSKTSDRNVIGRLDILPSKGRVAFMPFMSPIADTTYDKTYLEIAEDPETKFVSLADAKFRGLEVKELKLVLSVINPVTKVKMSSKKSYFFSPERQWLCHGSTEEIEEPGSTRYGEHYFGYEGEDDYPPLSVIELTIRNRENSSESKLHWRMEFTKFERVAPIDDAEFRLSAFGFPEPPEVNWRPTPWFLWLGLGGVLCLVLAGVVRWLKKRAARSPLISMSPPT